QWARFTCAHSLHHLRSYPIEAPGCWRVGQSELISARRPTGARRRHPVRRGERGLEFEGIDVVGAEVSPSETQRLPIRAHAHAQGPWANERHQPTGVREWVDCKRW